MKEYTITMKFVVETENTDYEKITLFAEELAENIMNENKLVCVNDIDVVEIIVQDILDDNDEEEEDDFSEEEDY